MARTYWEQVVADYYNGDYRKKSPMQLYKKKESAKTKGKGE
jgi:hypothetical protein